MADSKQRRQGGWVEALFTARATALGMNVARPWDGSLVYDFLVEAKGHLCRVQVKSCSYRRRDGWYQCNYRGFGRPPYGAGEFDFVAVYVIPEEFWYIIPMAAVSGLRQAFALLPHKPRSKYHRFEEAWHLLDGREARATGSE